MKRVCSYLLITTFVILGCAVREIRKEVKVPWLKPGTKMVYGVDFQGKKYDFIVNVKSLPPEIKFDWEMTEPVNKSGSILIKASALDTARGQFNYFRGGSKTLENATTVWVSKKVYKELKEKGTTKIILDSDSYTLSLKSKEKMKVSIDGTEKEIDVIYGEIENAAVEYALDESGNLIERPKNYKYWILDDPINPVIMRMVIDFEIGIKEITTR